MNSTLHCPGCGFFGRLPDGVAQLQTIVCPKCATVIPVNQIQQQSVAVQDASFPICVDGVPGQRLAMTESRALPEAPGAEVYTGDYMKAEAERFARFVDARLAELHKRRRELTEAECRFESMTMERKQEVHRQSGAVAAEAERLRIREVTLQAKETALVAREAEMATREAEVAAREARVARSEARAIDADRRMAELRAAIDQLEARRAALAEEKAALDQRAESLDRAELALHRRTAELDELDERLRLEQEEFEQEKERLLASQAQPGETTVSDSIPTQQTVTS